MDKKFTLLLLGPAGSGKSAFVAGLSKVDIFNYVTAKTQGGANTTKIATTYEFSNKCDKFSVIDCATIEDQQQEQILSELQDLSKQEDGLKKIFEKINDSKFSKLCTSVTIQLPCKEGIIPENSLFNTIVVRDSRGFGDIDDSNNVSIDELGVTHDVNTILFFSISSIQQPAVFSKIINKIMKVNLKTPMFLLRRDFDLTQNDVDFESEIIENISNSDNDLSKAVMKVDGECDKEYRLNKFVFNIPEVKVWKGALNIASSQTYSEIESYSIALKEILKYSVDMYNALYKILVYKLQGEYQNMFVDKVLNNLLTEKAFDVAANITNCPHSKPSENYPQDRDTDALSLPVALYKNLGIGEEPFRCELNTRGNKYADGKIPSYSYSCVNFRNIFHEIVYNLVEEYKLKALFSTFIDIVLKDYTVTTYTGYTFSNCKQDAFKFNQFIQVRDLCTAFLNKYSIVESNGKWKRFSYSTAGKKYTGSKAIAVLIYENLINSFNLEKEFSKYQQSTLKNECSEFVENNKKEEILEQMSRK
ncbi:hypothetical protein [Clostridium saccharoperbutylacetonicum]|uniref:hypothetical protein n=1 Tax=Clostridium saccharoperbutylacetonicum TaxID=36745 RepID=UPI000983AEF0|nr:hypothetical protein [Clostridium saccharoperbutylacetonicum]AQR93111.1 hypothetical protein CLSAP_03860 [Clostridium saccharoperbutylacetonicum]NSB34521.1 hypothetical protein [Clostridium saccharoperbutylacetonicum]